MTPRTDEERARAEFRHLADDGFQWWLRLPIVNLLWRRDFVRYAVSLDYLLGQVLDAVCALNRVRRRPDAFCTSKAIASLKHKPAGLAERIESICSLRGPFDAEEESRALVREVLALGRERFGLEFPWLGRVREPRRSRGFPLRPSPERHRALARRLSRAYRGLRPVVAVAVGGSVGTGFADETSDLDLEILCRSLPAAAERREVARRLADDPGDARVRLGKDETADEFFVDGILVDARYWRLPRWSALAGKPRAKSYWDEEALAHLDSMKALWDPDGIVRAHQSLLLDATRRARPRRLFEASARLRGAVDLMDAVARARCGNHGFLSASADAATAALGWLAALNDRWIVFPKWTRLWTRGLHVTLAGFCRRIEAIFLEAIPARRRREAASIVRSVARDLEGLSSRREIE